MHETENNVTFINNISNQIKLSWSFRHISFVSKSFHTHNIDIYIDAGGKTSTFLYVVHHLILNGCNLSRTKMCVNSKCDDENKLRWNTNFYFQVKLLSAALLRSHIVYTYVLWVWVSYIHSRKWNPHLIHFASEYLFFCICHRLKINKRFSYSFHKTSRLVSSISTVHMFYTPRVSKIAFNFDWYDFTQPFSRWWYRKWWYLDIKCIWMSIFFAICQRKLQALQLILKLLFRYIIYTVYMFIVQYSCIYTFF